MEVNATQTDSGQVIELRANRTQVRKAGYLDAWGIYYTLLDALDATETPLPDPELPYCIQAMLDRIHNGCAFVAVTPDDKIVGCVVLNIAHWPWVSPSSRKGAHFFNEHFWVDPKYRAGGTATKLLDCAKNLAASHGIPLQIEISSIDGNLELKDKFMRTRGFRQLGGKFYWSHGGNV